MANDEGIGDVYRIVGIRNIGTPRVFPKSNYSKKKKKRSETENPERTEEESAGPSTGPDEQSHGVDIKV
ncbi:MAG: hypothetical protein HQL08_08160 [Nitrospirae bacterium]|nr:hypothetical protein [Nitrospirota bacterium]